MNFQKKIEELEMKIFTRIFKKKTFFILIFNETGYIFMTIFIFFSKTASFS